MIQRKIAVTLIFAILFGASCQSVTTKKKSSEQQVKTLITKYGDCEGFETVRLGSMATMAIKMMLGANVGNDEEAEKALKALKGMKKFSLVNYEDCEGRVRESVENDMRKIVSESEMIMEVKDGGEKIGIYGIVDENGKEIKDVILFMPDSYTFIFCTGSISTETLTEMMD